MGTVYRVRVAAAAPDRDAIRTLVESRLDLVDRAMSTYREDSEVSRFNRLAAGEPFAFSEETRAVLELAWRVRDESGGAFDVTVGPLVDAWGFGAPGRGAAPTPPGEERLARLTRAVGAVEMRSAANDGDGGRLGDPPPRPRDEPGSASPERSLVKLDAGAALDLSAVAKGWAVDRVSEALTAAGYADHMVEVGGEVRTAGRGSSGGPWRIAIERPPAKLPQPESGASAEAAAGGVPSGLQQVLEFADGALATSGDYRNYWERDGVRYSHTIDPRTGRPVEHALASASVFRDTCAEADAYSTALMVLGPDEGLRWADRHGIAALLLLYRGEEIAERRSAAFRDRFGPEDR